MLIRLATENDLEKWFDLATEVSPIFRHPADMAKDPEFIAYAKNKVSKYEALIAIDRMKEDCIGIIGFSRTNNRITWFAVTEKYRQKGVGSRLLKTALRQLDHTKPITVETYPDDYIQGIPAKNLYRKFAFVETEGNLKGPHGEPICRMTLDLSEEKRGQSFHYRYDKYLNNSNPELCTVCNLESTSEGYHDIELPHAWVVIDPYDQGAQGRLFGKCFVCAKPHYVHFHEMTEADMTGFMKDVQRVGKVLQKLTGAVRINYELHCNSHPHLHIHLFPRYLDDDFPSAPIEYRLTEPSPYESKEEYLWFAEGMKAELKE